MADLKTRIGNLELANPVLTASGTFGYGTEYEDFIDLSRLGGVIVTHEIICTFVLQTYGIEHTGRSLSHSGVRIALASFDCCTFHNYPSKPG